MSNLYHEEERAAGSGGGESTPRGHAETGTGVSGTAGASGGAGAGREAGGGGREGGEQASKEHKPYHVLTRDDRSKGGTKSASTQGRDEYGQFAGRQPRPPRTP
jgi:hypothetical protein